MVAPNVAVGWKGYLLVGSAANPIPYLSEDITEKDTHIPSGDVHGGGISQQTTGPFFSQLNAADGTLTFDGSINGHVYSGAPTETPNFGAACRDLFSKAVSAEDRQMGYTPADPLVVSPGGAGIDTLNTAFQYPASVSVASVNRGVVSSLSVTGSAGNIIDYTIGFMSTTRESSTDKPAATSLDAETAGDDSGSTNPVAWHNVLLTFNETAAEGIGEEVDLFQRVTDWTVDLTNNTIPLDTFNRARTKRDLYQGELEVTGSFTYYAPEGVFRSLNKIFGSDSQAGIKIEMGEVDPITLELTLVILDPAPIPGPGVNELVTRNVTFRALATNTKASLVLS